jgi:plasmid segregation protein ParM
MQSTPKHVPVVAVDVGYGNTKVCAIHDLADPSSKWQRFMFPSLAPAFEPLGADLGQFSGQRDTKIVCVYGQLYEVGKDVGALPTSVDSGQVLLDRFVETPEYTALLAGAIAHTAADSIGLLVLGLPVHNYRKYRPLLEAEYGKQPSLVDTTDGTRVAVQGVIVIPQPCGAAFNRHSQVLQSGQQVNNDRTLVIDVGYYTTDWVVVQGLTQLEPRRVGGTPSGASTLYRAIAKEISKAQGESFDDLNRVDLALRSDGSMRFYKHTLNVHDHTQSCAPLIERVMRQMETSIGLSSDIASILLVGGGARLFESAIKARFHKQELLTGMSLVLRM